MSWDCIIYIEISVYYGDDATQIFERPGQYAGQGHLCCLLTHLELKINCVIDVTSSSNIWLGDSFLNCKIAYAGRKQLANKYFSNKQSFVYRYSIAK